MTTTEKATETKAEQDTDRGPARVEIVVRDAAAEQKPKGRFGRALLIGFAGAFLFGVIASVAGYNFLPWYHMPETAGITGEKLNGLVRGAAIDALRGFMLTQGIAATAGFALFFVYGFMKFGKKK